MATQTASCHNPGARSSGKRDFSLAAKVARELGLVPTWPNLQIIRLAIESEILHLQFFRVRGDAVARMMIRAANENSAMRYADWFERAKIYRSNCVDRFWFEDGRWREKIAYLDFLDELREQSAC